MKTPRGDAHHATGAARIRSGGGRRDRIPSRSTRRGPRPPRLGPSGTARCEREQQHAEDQDRDRVAEPPGDPPGEVHREVVVEAGHRVAPIAPDRGAFLDRRRGLRDEVASDLGGRSDHHVAVEDDDVSLDGSGDVHIPVQDPQGLLDRPIHLRRPVQDHCGVDGLVLCDDEPTCQHDLIVRGRRAFLCQSRSRQERSRSDRPREHQEHQTDAANRRARNGPSPVAHHINSSEFAERWQPVAAIPVGWTKRRLELIQNKNEERRAVRPSGMPRPTEAGVHAPCRYAREPEPAATNVGTEQTADQRTQEHRSR